MPDALTLLMLLTGLVLGYGVARARSQRELRVLDDALHVAREELVGARAEAEARRQAQAEGVDRFQAVASKALAANNEQFLELAKAKLETARTESAGELEKRQQAIAELVKPLNEQLKELQRAARELEGKREKAYGEIQAQFSHLSRATEQLNVHSAALETALRGSSQARGRWGELALRNIVELAGMTRHCDFSEQTTEAEGLRPDLLVRLPGGGAIPVDAKVPLSDYMKACDESDPARRDEHLKAHATALRSFARDLARKDYASAVGAAVQFTVLFVPAEPILAAAFERQPELQQEAFSKSVLIATPVTLIALLRTVGIYWQQQRVEENADKVWRAAREFYERAQLFRGHFADVGKGLETAVQGYNRAVRSFERRLVPSGRKLEELGAVPEVAKAIGPPDLVERQLEEFSAESA